MPTAVFYSDDDGSRRFGRAAIAAYVDGYEGRLMRSIKSILGSDLMDETTELASGLQIRYVDVVIAYLRHIKQLAEKHWQRPIDRAVIGRPVFFVDDDPRRDAKAQQTLFEAAHAAGIAHVEFQFEPIAAALDYESRLRASDGERLVLVADIGGGTSDFSVVRASEAAHGLSRPARGHSGEPRPAFGGHRFRPGSESRQDHAGAGAERRRSGRPSCAFEGLLRAGHLASDQHDLRSEPTHRVTHDAQHVQRSACAPAADARTHAASRARSRGACRSRQDRGVGVRQVDH